MGADLSCAHLTSVRLTNAGTCETFAPPGRVDIKQMDERNDIINNLLGDKSPDVMWYRSPKPSGFDGQDPSSQQSFTSITVPYKVERF